MDIEKIKKLENVKAEKETLSKEIHNLILDERKRLLFSMKSDFKEYFSSKGFNTTEQSIGITASYGHQNFILALPPPETIYMGGFAIVELSLTGTIKKKYSIRANTTE